jgi:cell division GTPase FtsZ
MSMNATATANRPAFGLPGRIQSPNSKPRSIALVGLGAGGAAIARRISAEGLSQLDVHVFTSASGRDALADIKSGGEDLQRALGTADMIFIVTCRGDDVGLVPVVSRVAHSGNHAVTALYIVPPETALSEEEDNTLKTLRAGVEMLVVVSDESYVAAMIAALGG